MQSNYRGVPLDDVATLIRKCGLEVESQPDSLRFEATHGPAEIRVLAPQEPSLDDVPLKAVVLARTRLPDELLFDDPKIYLWANRRAAMGAFTVMDGKLYVVSRLTTYEGEDSWDLHSPLLAFAAAFSGDAMDPRTLAQGPRAAPVWPGEDFAGLEKELSRFCVCNGDDAGFTAEFPLRAGSGCAGLGDQRTALLRMMTDEPHPIIGSGLLVVLEMPHQFPSPDDLAKVVERLNAWEAEPGDRVPHYGAWCAGGVGNPAYASFVPGGLRRPGLARNFVTWMRARALLADGFLLSLGKTIGINEVERAR